MKRALPLLLLFFIIIITIHISFQRNGVGTASEKGKHECHHWTFHRQQQMSLTVHLAPLQPLPDPHLQNLRLGVTPLHNTALQVANMSRSDLISRCKTIPHPWDRAIFPKDKKKIPYVHLNNITNRHRGGIKYSQVSLCLGQYLFFITLFKV